MAKTKTKVRAEKQNGYHTVGYSPIKEENRVVEITTSLGESYEVFPVGVTTLTGIANKVKTKFEEKGKSIDPPTIKLPAAPGAASVEFSLDNLEACKVEDDSEETSRRIKAFEQYQSNLNEYGVAVEQAQQKALFIFGLCKIPGRNRGIDPITEEDEWVQFNKAFMEIPTERNDFLFWYISERILPTPEDKYKLAIYVRAANGMAGVVDSSIIHEKVAEMMPSFRDKVGKQLQKVDFSAGIT